MGQWRGIRETLAFLEQHLPGDVLRIPEEVDRDHIGTALVFELEQDGRSPVVVLERVRGSDLPVVTNLAGSRTRMACLIGVPLPELTARWGDWLTRLVPTRTVGRGPVQEVTLSGDALDLTKLPIPWHFGNDAGRYITGGIVVAHDPDTGVPNLSYARMQVKGPHRLGVSFHSRGHLWDYVSRAEARGRNLEVAIVIGVDPIVLVAAAARTRPGVNEYEIAGAMRGAPLEVVPCASIGVAVPAHAELVIEGEVLAGVREDEGPFGEYTGYCTGRSTRHVIQVHGGMRRRDAIYLDVTPGYSSEHLLLGRSQKEHAVLTKLRETVPSVVSVHYPKSGTHFHCYVNLKKEFEGQPKHAATLLLGLDPYVKLVIVVDDDVDVTREEDVLWALATRFQADRGTFVIPDMFCNLLDPSSRNGTSAKLALDATRPLDWRFERHTIPDTARAEAQRLLACFGQA